ncbi:YidH family protein [Pedomonas mirosovicensis]|uniref:YidH family protein n=1 Tax=Pedomonas mirosovicensis TaxID=2908641 RepID=UPI0021673FDA|nr:DUF202 domain-containing protein [Pedomonas mirosovicensis]MCH8686771.1 DUF202 domain-containing protein [Pedomonas mirosovicensis]
MSTPLSERQPPRRQEGVDGRIGDQTEQLRKSATSMEESSKAVERNTKQASDSADRRTALAGDRTIFAAERTYAAWVRTGLGSLASGIGARALLEGIVADWLVIATGTVLVLLSAFCFVAGIWRYLRPGAPLGIPDVRRLPAVLLIGVNAFFVLVALAALYGIWSGDFVPQK